VGNRLELSGQKFGMLTAIRPIGRGKHKEIIWLFQCDCGRLTEVIGSKVKCGATKSCGCLVHNNGVRTHGLSKTSTYRTWQSMRQRCQNPDDYAYKHYGSRGIKVCERWDKFENFLEDMGERPKGLTIERIDNDKGYFPKNCKWATMKDQLRNRRNVRLNPLKASVIKKLLTDSQLLQKEIAELFGVNKSTICDVNKGRRWADIV